MIEAKPYKYQGNQDWSPGQLGPVVTPAQRASDRAVKFAELRGQGLTIAQAARATGITTKTGYKYEAARKAAAGNQPAGGAS